MVLDPSHWVTSSLQAFPVEGPDMLGPRQATSAVPFPDFWPTSTVSIIKWLLLYSAKFGLLYDVNSCIFQWTDLPVATHFEKIYFRLFRLGIGKGNDFIKNLFIRTINNSDSLQRFFFLFNSFVRLQSIKFTVYSPEEIPLIVQIK